MYGEKFYQLHAAQRQLLRPFNNLEKNGSITFYKKYAQNIISPVGTWQIETMKKNMPTKNL